MDFYRITFSTRPESDKNSDNPPTPFVRYYKGDKKPTSALLNQSFISSMGNAAKGLKVVKTEIHKISEIVFNGKGKNEELFY
jgi:hypothetical protein